MFRQEGYIRQKTIELWKRYSISSKQSSGVLSSWSLGNNDVLIIAPAKLHGIGTIASFDADFQPACEGEHIQLIREITDVA